MTISISLPVLNLAEARFECTFGRGCDGICCREGKPPMYPEDVARIDANLEKILPRMRDEARAVVVSKGFLTQRLRNGLPTLRNAGGWCVFFNEGCVLHRIGAEEGEVFRYKPSICALFPVQTDDNGNWYVRQKGYKRERWDLFCLDPQNSRVPAAESLREELALAQRFEGEYQAEASKADA